MLDEARGAHTAFADQDPGGLRSLDLALGRQRDIGATGLQPRRSDELGSERGTRRHEHDDCGRSEG